MTGSLPTPTNKKRKRKQSLRGKNQSSGSAAKAPDKNKESSNKEPFLGNFKNKQERALQNNVPDDESEGSFNKKRRQENDERSRDTLKSIYGVFYTRDGDWKLDTRDGDLKRPSPFEHLYDLLGSGRSDYLKNIINKNLFNEFAKENSGMESQRLSKYITEGEEYKLADRIKGELPILKKQINITSDKLNRIKESGGYELQRLESELNEYKQKMAVLEQTLNSCRVNLEEFRKEKNNVEAKASDYFHVTNDKYTRGREYLKGRARRIIVNVKNQEAAISVARSLTNLFKEEEGSYIRSYKVLLSTESQEANYVKHDKLVIYYALAEPKGDLDIENERDVVGDRIVAVIDKALPWKNDFDDNFAPFYSRVAPGIAWAEEPKHHSEARAMQDSFTETRSKIIEDVIRNNAVVKSSDEFIKLVNDALKKAEVDHENPHRHLPPSRRLKATSQAATRS